MFRRSLLGRSLITSGRGSFRQPSAIFGAGALAGSGVVLENWWHPDAIIQIDYAEDRGYYNGTAYSSIADMVTAGVLTDSAGDRLSVVGLLPSVYTMVFWGVHPTLGGTSRYAMTLDNGATGTATDQMVAMLDDTGNSGRSACYVFTNSSQVGVIETGAASLTAGDEIVYVGTFETNNVRFVVDDDINTTASSAPVVRSDTSVALPSGLTQLVIGDRHDATRTWGASNIYAAALLDLNPTNGELKMLGGYLRRNMLRNCTYTPWYSEPGIAQIANGRMVVAWTNTAGSTGVSEVEIATGNVLAIRVITDGVYVRDEHMSPAAIFLDDGRLICIGTGHGTAGDVDGLDINYIYYSISTTGRVADLSAPTGITNTTHRPNYMNIFERSSDDEIWFMTHDDEANGSSASPNMVLFRKVGAGAFTETRAFAGQTGNQLYGQIGRVSNDEIWVFIAEHDSTASTRWRLVAVNLDTGVPYYKSSGGTTTSGADIFTDTANKTPIFTWNTIGTPWALTSGKKQIELILKDDGSMAMFQEVNNSDGLDSVLKLARYTGTNPWNHSDWTIVDLPWGSYYSDACFARESHSGIRVYYTWNDSGTYKLVRADSSDNGATWTETVVHTSTKELRRPVSPKNATSGFPVICTEHRYRDSFNNFDTDVVWPPIS